MTLEIINVLNYRGFRGYLSFFVSALLRDFSLCWDHLEVDRRHALAKPKGNHA